jgi:WD repeat-containing protein 48
MPTQRSAARGAMAVGGGARYASYMLRSPEKRPRSGVNALAVSQDAATVFAAGRDGVVRAWDAAGASEPCAAFEEHADWVNDVLLVQAGERLVSASSDTTLKVWNAADPRFSLRTLDEHDDYVKALAPLADGAVVSGALDGRVLVWDLATGRVRGECGAEPADRSDGIGFGVALNGSGGAGSGGGGGGGGRARSSVYCLASCTDPQASCVVTGSTDRVITVYDARSGQTVVRLRGHADTIRCLALKHDASLLLSGSSDMTVRLWDVRQQRCLRTYDSHPGDSVWALDAPRSFETFVSGGRDGAVWNTSLDGDYASLIVAVADPEKRSSMVLDVALAPGDDRRVWVSTTGSTVRQWAVPPVDSVQGADGFGRTNGVASESAAAANGGANGVDDQMDYEPATAAAAAASAGARAHHAFGGTRPALIELVGLPAIIAYKIMNNRRHVMTRDTADEVCIWDVTSASLHRALGKLPPGMELDSMAEKHDEIVSVPSWFKVDIRLGSLVVKLAKSTVGDAEVYAVDAGLEAETEDVKVNIGEHVLRGLLSVWKERLEAESAASAVVGNGPASGGAGAGRGAGAAAINGASATAADAGSATASPARPAAPTLPPYQCPPETPIVISDESPIPRLIRAAGAFTGEAELFLLPPWVVDVVRDGRTMARELSPKLGFTLHPVEGSGLPDLPKVSLTAPLVLRIRKVASYAAGELNAIVEASLTEKIEAEHLDILCHGKLVPPLMNLATTKKFMWQSAATGDLVLTFRKSSKTSAAMSAAFAAAAAAAASGSAASRASG